MENSFFEYRDITGVDDSDTEIIDDSIVLDQSIVSKKPGFKNQTVYIAESEDSQSEGTEFNLYFTCDRYFKSSSS